MGNHVWVVERKDRGKFKLVGMWEFRSEAQNSMDRMKRLGELRQYRVVKYIPEDK